MVVERLWKVVDSLGGTLFCRVTGVKVIKAILTRWFCVGASQMVCRTVRIAMTLELSTEIGKSAS